MLTPAQSSSLGQSCGDLRNCNDETLVVGDQCEGDGECKTDNNLNNCDDDFDIYIVEMPIPSARLVVCSTLTPLNASNCDLIDVVRLPTCDNSTLVSGDLCKYHKELEYNCYSDNDFNNCDGYDIYTVIPDYGACPMLTPNIMDASECDPNVFFHLRTCDDPTLVPGDLCKGGGECNTDLRLYNCGSVSVYRVSGQKTRHICCSVVVDDTHTHSTHSHMKRTMLILPRRLFAAGDTHPRI